MTQQQMVLEHLKDKGSITSFQAFQLFGCTRLAAQIFNLKEKGYDIQTSMVNGVNRYGEPTRYAVYLYKEAD